MSACKVVLLFLAFISYGSVVRGDTGDEKYERRPWYFGLFWNLLGYATVIVPGAIIIRMVKKSNFKDSGGNNFKPLLCQRGCIVNLNFFFNLTQMVTHVCYFNGSFI